MNKSPDLPHTFPDISGRFDIFDEFFESGKEESVSPFLTPQSRRWGKHLSLKSSIIAAFLLVCSLFPPLKEISPLLLLFSYFFAGTLALIGSIEDILNFKINIDVLMTLAAFLSILIGSGYEGALLLVLFSFSESLEEMVQSKARGSIRAIKKMAPTKAYVIGKGGMLIERSVKDIKIGTLVFVKLGEVVPLDGRVKEGISSVNLAHITGENAPILKKPGDEIVAGARVLEGALTIEVIRTSSDSTISQIIKLITQAALAKPKIERFLDKFSSRYAITIIASALAISLLLPLFFALPYLGKEGSIYRGLTFLIAASPCALIIAVPIAYLSAVSVAARKGILLKGGSILDALASCKTIAFDKTGTLTHGALTFEKILGAGDRKKALQVAVSLERNVLHPIGQAIVAQGEKESITPLQVEAFASLPGYGLEGVVEGKKVYIGNKEFIFPKAPRFPDIKEDQTRTFLLWDGEVFTFLFQDRLRENVTKTLKALKEKWKLRLLMITGDTYESAKKIASQAEIDEFYASCTPEEKLKKIDELAKQGDLAMVGDGINDAPSLARATVGISMGQKGSKTAVDASDVVLLNDNIEHLEWLYNIAHATKKIVNQNLFFAIGAIIVATGPALFGWIPLWLAVLLHEGGTVVVGLNALRLLGKR